MTISKMYGTAVIKKNEISAQIPCISIAVQRRIQKNKYRNMVTIASLVVLSFFAPSSLRIPLPLKIIRLI